MNGAAIYIIGILLLLMAHAYGQQEPAPFEQVTVDAGNIGLTLSNAATIGRPEARNDPSGPPSMEYPLNSGIEHLFEGGIWIGAKVNGQTTVSTGAIDAPAGYSTGARGFEFNPLGAISQRSSLTSSEFFSFDATSHQDVLTDFSDRFTVVGGNVIQDHDLPLNADVHLEGYAWNYSFADYFVILNYTITNNASFAWDSVYLGLWTDLVVRNINVATDAGTAFFNKGGGGYLDSSHAIYAFDVSGDPGYTNSYGAQQFLGIEWRNRFIHPSNADTLIAEGLPMPRVNANFWVFRSFQGSTFVGPFDQDGSFNDDLAYQKMQNGLNFQDPQLVEDLQNPANRTQLLSAGPIIEITPGETVNFVMAMVTAKQVETGGATGPDMDTEFARTSLVNNLGWARRTYNGEDINGNGRLDNGEDLDGDGELDRYILPEPPATPKTRVVVANQKVTIYWDDRAEFSIDPISKEMDFEGYRLYRTGLGGDVQLEQEPNLLRQWDTKSNSIGFNNGFQEIRLDQPVTFADDTTAYFYKYEVNGLLNGWQYTFILTSFDRGNKELLIEPLESSFVENTANVFVGTPLNNDFENIKVGVYPNPYRISAAWDGGTPRTKKIYFYNLPPRCLITVYTLSGDIVAQLEHDADTYTGSDIGWFENFAGEASDRVFSGGEHAWDLLSETGQSITQGLYLFSVKSIDTEEVQNGRFAILK